ncbi:MAG: efflux RND transporter periplasmic adaptor subunit [Chloroflexi bacterium]|nr:efflux RND transporter periplasmic adaptor subunit [Chloroflexota bacterium]
MSVLSRQEQRTAGSLWRVLWRRRLLVVAVALVAVAGGMTYQRLTAAPGEAVSLQTAPVQRATVQASVTGTGTVKALQTANLAFRTSGQVVEEVYVKLGDAVKKGDPLARIDARTLEFQVRQGEMNLRTAELNLETLTAAARPEDIASAQAAVESARQKLTTMEAQGHPADVAVAEASLQSAQAKLAQLRNPSAADLAAAQAAVESARANLQSAQTKLDQLKHPTAKDLLAAESAVVSARADLQNAQTKLEQLRNPSPADLTAAEANLESAKNKLTDLQERPTTAVFEEAQRAVDSAKAALLEAQRHLAGFDNQLADVSGGAAYRSAWSSLNTARAKLEQDMAGNVAPSQIQADQVAVQEAWQRLEDAQRDLVWSQLGFTAGDYAAAQLAVTAATKGLQDTQKKLADLDPVPTAGELRAAELAVESAQVKLDQLKNPLAADLAAAQAAVEGARSRLQQAQATLDQLRNPQPADLAAAESAVTTAQANLQSAQVKLDQLKHPTAEDLAAAQAAVLQAQNQLEKTRLPYKEADLAAQRAAVEQTIAQLERTQNPSTAQDLAKAQLNVDKAKMDLDQTRDNLANAVLRAPFDGVVNALNLNPGETAGSSAAVVLVNPNALRIDLTISEIDIARIERNQLAQITFDAVPRPYTGKVIAVAADATVQQGVTTYLVTVEVNQPRGLRPGMTASASIVYASREEVLVVPNRAIRNRTVQVLVDGKPETRQVRLGLSDERNTEILEGLNEGDQVVTNAPTASSTGTTPQGQFRPGAGGFGGGIPGGGGFGGGRR